MKVLCPIDFSAHSVSALKYASRTARDMQAELHVIHVFRLSTVVENFKELKEDMANAHQAKIDELTLALPGLSNKEVISSVLYGSTSTKILEYAEREGISLIVLGSEGNSTLANRLLGSVANEVVQKSSCPVLVIPSKKIVEYAPSKMLLALDSLELEHETSFAVPSMLAKKWHCSIDILHVNKKEETDIPFDPFDGNFLKDCLGEVHVISDKDIGHGMMTFVEQNEYQLLIMVKRQKGFWANLFRKNHIEEEVLASLVPLLIIPE